MTVFLHLLFSGVRLPSSSRTIYSYFVDMDSGNFLTWDSLVPSTQSLIEKGAVITIGETMGVSPDGKGPKKPSTDGDIVTTVDTVRYSFLSGLLLLNKKPVLLTGLFPSKYQSPLDLPCTLLDIISQFT